MSVQSLLRSGAGKSVLNFAQQWCNCALVGNAVFSTRQRQMSSDFSTPRLNLNFHNDGTALVTMKSGDNRLHPEMLDQWHLVMDEIEKNPACKVMVTKGEDKFYSNGLDLQYVKTFTNHELQLGEYLDKLNRMVVRVLTFPLPTVAAINGHAFAGGAVLALGHDLRVMREDRGWLCLNEILVDVRFPAVLMSLMRAKITSASAQTQAILFAKRHTATEALKSGLVDKVASESELVDVAKQLGHEVLGKDGIKRENLATFKKDLYRSVLKTHQIHF